MIRIFILEAKQPFPQKRMSPLPPINHISPQLFLIVMNIEEVREYCLKLKNSTESFPFDENVLVFKVEDKMYLAIWLGEMDEPRIAVKCDPDEALLLRERYKAVEPAYHFNKRHWNDIYLDRDMNDDEVRRWIRHSYEEVILQLPLRIRKAYELL